MPSMHDLVRRAVRGSLRRRAGCELARLAPGARVAGFGGEHLREAGATLVGDFSGLTVTGLVEALRVLPRSWRCTGGC